MITSCVVSEQGFSRVWSGSYEDLTHNKDLIYRWIRGENFAVLEGDEPIMCISPSFSKSLLYVSVGFPEHRIINA